MTSKRTHEKTDLKVWLEQVEQLRHAPEWPAGELPVEMRQTHISVLLLSRTRVAKLKKPVDFGFLDYTTVEKRRRACEAEIRLNRRLCPDTYIGLGGVIDLDGQIRFSGRTGRIVDYCVWMKRLPDDRMLDQLVARREATEAMIDRIAACLTEFHRTASRGADISKWGGLAELRHNWSENFTQTEPFIGRTISEPAFEALRQWVNDGLEQQADLFHRRQQEGRIVDGHGDVRCESICVTDEVIYIYDCIEFNDRFRCSDVASEAAFLAMDLDARGRPDLGYFFTEAYQGRTGDEDFFRLLPFYRCYRAYVRGKVLSFRLNEPEFSAAEQRQAAGRAAAYFELARRYASRLQRPTVVAVGGLSGTGKTSVARAIAGELGLRVISADAVRQALFGAAKGPAEYGEGVYTDEANRRTYQQMFEEARGRLAPDGGVVIDATFRRAEDRAAARELARSAGAEWRMIECQLPPQQVRARLAQRAALQEGASDATWNVYQRQREESAPFCRELDESCLSLDTGGDLSATGHAATDWLRRRDAAGKNSELE